MWFDVNYGDSGHKSLNAKVGHSLASLALHVTPNLIKVKTSQHMNDGEAVPLLSLDYYHFSVRSQGKKKQQ